MLGSWCFGTRERRMEVNKGSRKVYGLPRPPEVPRLVVPGKGIIRSTNHNKIVSAFRVRSNPKKLSILPTTTKSYLTVLCYGNRDDLIQLDIVAGVGDGQLVGRVPGQAGQLSAQHL